MADQAVNSFEQLLDLAEGRVSAEEQQRLRDRIAADPALQAQQAWIEAFLIARRQLPLMPAPATLRTTLRERFQIYAAQHTQPTMLQRFVASLRFDSFTSTVPGLRSAGSVAQRQLAFASDVADLMLSVLYRPQNATIEVSGQIFFKTEQPAEPMLIELNQAEMVCAMTQTDPLGEFFFRDLQPGQYQLHVRAAALDISIEMLDLQQA
ncbi:MAG: hypothetical protein Fur005_20800 [Roseiflexaceae bacterium]